MEIKIPIFIISTIKKLFRKPVYVFEVPFVYPDSSVVNDLILNTYIDEKDRDKLKYGAVSNVRMCVNKSDYDTFIHNITIYYKNIRVHYPKYIIEILRKSQYIVNWAESYDQIDIVI